MKNKRRDFIKLSGLAGAGMILGAGQANSMNPFSHTLHPRFNMHGYAAPKLETVRVGFIGVGSRGSGTVQRLASIEGVDIKALCDIVPERVSDTINSIKGLSHTPDSYTNGEDAWKELLDREDIDLIYIGTPWKLHAPIAARAMEHDKHVYTEIPVGTTIEECWQVVETSERTRKHCFMGCGSCHDGMSAVTLNMVRDGFFGELIHGEGNYIHDRVSDPDRWVMEAQQS